MTNRFSSAAYRSASLRSTVYMGQTNRDLPFGDVAAMAALAKTEGASVTQISTSGFCVDNTAFVNYAGAVRFI